MSAVMMLGLATAHPLGRYFQREIPGIFGLKDPGVLRFFEFDHIQSRYLELPPADQASGLPTEETQGQLLSKFKRMSLDMGERAINECLKGAGVPASEIAYLCCVTSTGFIIPGLSALLVRDLGMDRSCQRTDIVGMGCNAGLNGLNTTTSWCRSNPGKYAVMLCVEACSAIYAIDDTPRTAIVNSLFGDGAAAVLLKDGEGVGTASGPRPRVIAFESHLIHEHSTELRFDWDDQKGRYSFYVGRKTPAAIAAVADQPVNRLLERFGLTRADISHWVIHGGGSAILEGLRDRLGLTDQDVRHTRSVLRDYGNVSSGSYLFSLRSLLDEGKVRSGDWCLMMAMGPGLTIELALARMEG